MAEIATVDIPMKDVLQSLEVKVRLTGIRTWELRCWLALRLIKLGGIVMGTPIIYEEDHES